MKVILIRNIYEKIISNHKIDEFDIKFFWPREYLFFLTENRTGIMTEENPINSVLHAC